MLLLLFSFLSMASDKGIIGDLDWREITTFSIESPEYKNSLNIGRITNDLNETCNGTLISTDAVVTALHCYNRGIRFRGIGCTRVGPNSARDIVYLFCPGSGSPSTEINITNHLTDNIYILHYQCNWEVDPYCKATMKYSPGVIVRAGADYLTHTADTLPGTSGAPIFNSGHELIGIHNGYYPDAKLNTGSLIK